MGLFIKLTGALVAVVVAFGASLVRREQARPRHWLRSLRCGAARAPPPLHSLPYALLA